MAEQYLYTTNKIEETKLNVWCCFPAVYNFGMSSLGFLTVFKHIDTIDGVFAERIFTDTEKTQIKKDCVDVMTFSFSFEMDYLGMLQIMEKYDVSFLAEERDENAPLICGGGPVLTSNPEPFSKFFDFIMIGDAESHIQEIFEILKNNNDKTKIEKLNLIKDIEGVYIPAFKTDVYRVKKVTSNHNKCTATPILTENSYFPNTYIIEMERGCPKACAFCLTSYINTPVRFFPYENIIEEIDNGLKYTNKLALLGALICAHPRFDDICQYVIDKIDNGQEIEMSVSSLRADYVSDKTLELLKKCGQRTATIAIEAGSERLRKVINKQLTKENIFSMVEKMYNFGFSGLKIYGIIGLPTETYEDLDEFVNLCKELKQKFKGFGLTPSFSTFVPKAQTPFHFAKKDDTKTLEKKIEYLKKQFVKLGIKARFSSAKWDYIQALLSRGDNTLTPYLINVYKQGGNLGAFKNEFKQFKKDFNYKDSDEIALSEFSIDNLPWNFIDFICNNNRLNELYNKYINE